MIQLNLNKDDLSIIHAALIDPRIRSFFENEVSLSIEYRSVLEIICNTLKKEE